MTESTKRKTAIVRLEEPLTRGETRIDELTLRRPDSGSLRGLSMMDVVKMDTFAVSRLLPRISSPSLTDEEIAALSPADLFACAAEIADFFMTSADREKAASLMP